MMDHKTNTSFRIAISVSMVILMLGVAIFLNVFTTYDITNRIKVISNLNMPMGYKVSHMQGIQEVQFDSFENAIKYKGLASLSNYESSKNQFEMYDIEFNYQIKEMNDLIDAFLHSGSVEDITELSKITSSLNEIESMHFQYVQKVEQIFENGQTKENIVDLETDQNQLNVKITLLNNQIQKLTNSLEDGIDASKQKSLTLQTIIMISAGIISLSLCYFLNLINKDLINEVFKKTRSLQNANKKLERMNLLKDDFINIASHELKSPLHPICGFVELAENGDIGKDEALAGISKQAQHLEEVANRILDISKLNNGVLHLSYERFNLHDLLTEIISFYKLSINEKITIETNFEKDIEIEADRIRISQVIRNLINNALKFTNNGKILVSAFQDLQKNIVTVRIKDSGTGIHPEIIHNLFDKYATKGPEKELRSGTGLGLYLCKGIINAHGGKILGYNNVDSGATLEFNIPILRILNIKESHKKIIN